MTTYKLIAVSDPAPEVRIVVDGQEIAHDGPGVVELTVEGDLDLMIFKNGEPVAAGRPTLPNPTFANRPTPNRED